MDPKDKGVEEDDGWSEGEDDTWATSVLIDPSEAIVFYQKPTEDEDEKKQPADPASSFAAILFADFDTVTAWAREMSRKPHTAEKVRVTPELLNKLSPFTWKIDFATLATPIRSANVLLASLFFHFRSDSEAPLALLRVAHAENTMFVLDTSSLLSGRYIPSSVIPLLNQVLDTVKISLRSTSTKTLLENIQACTRREVHKYDPSGELALRGVVAEEINSCWAAPLEDIFCAPAKDELEEARQWAGSHGLRHGTDSDWVRAQMLLLRKRATDLAPLLATCFHQGPLSHSLGRPTTLLEELAFAGCAKALDELLPRDGAAFVSHSEFLLHAAVLGGSSLVTNWLLFPGNFPRWLNPTLATGVDNLCLPFVPGWSNPRPEEELALAGQRAFVGGGLPRYTTPAQVFFFARSQANMELLVEVCAATGISIDQLREWALEYGERTIDWRELLCQPPPKPKPQPRFFVF